MFILFFLNIKYTFKSCILYFIILKTRRVFVNCEYFRALKTKGNTPKYGLIFHSSFIGRAAAKNKGRISRYLANKCSIASRIDCFSGSKWILIKIFNYFVYTYSVLQYLLKANQ